MSGTTRIVIDETVTSVSSVETYTHEIQVVEQDIGQTILALVQQKGDLLLGTAQYALTRKAVGANNTVLTADSTDPTGVAWKSSSGGTTFELTNKSGNDVLLGMIARLDPDNADSFLTSSVENDLRCFMVVCENIANNAIGKLSTAGKLTVLTTGTVSVGDWLVQSSTLGRAKSAGRMRPLHGGIGIATTSASGTSSVSAVILTEGFLPIGKGKTFIFGNSGATTTCIQIDGTTEVSSNLASAALPTAQANLVGLASDVASYMIGNASGNAFKMPFATLVTATQVSANCPSGMTYAPSNGVYDASTKGIFAGIHNGTTYIVSAYKTTFATNVTAANASSNLTVARSFEAVLIDTSYGYFMGGYGSANSLVCDRLNISTEVTAAFTSGNLTVARGYTSGCAGMGTYGYVAGANSTLVDRINFATGVTAANAYSLVQTRYSPVNSSPSNNGGMIFGGSGSGLGAATYSSAEHIDYASGVISATNALPQATTMASSTYWVNG